VISKRNKNQQEKLFTSDNIKRNKNQQEKLFTSDK
jgi:hypothetical protein